MIAVAVLICSYTSQQKDKIIFASETNAGINIDQDVSEDNAAIQVNLQEDTAGTEGTQEEISIYTEDTGSCLECPVCADEGQENSVIAEASESPKSIDVTATPNVMLNEQDNPGKTGIKTGGYAVASSSSEATLAGIEILENGGNAIDAAVAVAFALSVAEPYSSGIGGGGFMLVYDPGNDEAWSVDYYTAAGGAETQSGNTGVPGFLAGMQAALDTWGTMSLSNVMEPAIKLAEDGFTVTDTFMTRLAYSSTLLTNPAFAGIKAGDNLVQSELADTLKQIQVNGIDAFYNGSIGKDFACASGLMVDDLASYEVVIERAVQCNAFGHTLYATTAPSSGITTLQMVKLAEMLDIETPEQNTLSYINDLRTITTAAYSSRSKTLVDPRFYDIDYDTLLSDEYLTELITNESMADDAERHCTTQFSVIDQNGMIVCCTNTLSDSWGSYQMVDGFYMNDTLSLFGSSEKLSYEPYKRPRTHFSPIIVRDMESDNSLAIGSPGGNNIPRVIASVLIDVLKNGTDVQAAVDKARVLIDEDGYVCMETEDVSRSIIDTSKVTSACYWNSSHIYFGCTSVVGYISDYGVFAVCDLRRKTAAASSE